MNMPLLSEYWSLHPPRSPGSKESPKETNVDGRAVPGSPIPLPKKELSPLIGPRSPLPSLAPRSDPSARSPSACGGLGSSPALLGSQSQPKHLLDMRNEV